jgi:hypothetical protein
MLSRKGVRLAMAPDTQTDTSEPTQSIIDRIIWHTTGPPTTWIGKFTAYLVALAAFGAAYRQLAKEWPDSPQTAEGAGDGRERGVCGAIPDRLGAKVGAGFRG